MISNTRVSKVTIFAQKQSCQKGLINFVTKNVTKVTIIQKIILYVF